MANTKNSQAAKIRQQIITWLQDEHETEAVSAEKFQGFTEFGRSSYARC
ncbi:hypothetical protein L3X07_02320 [Levilactobacillus brevis]|nr:hypothetical protein [Levilactobacillus brevis]